MTAKITYHPGDRCHHWTLVEDRGMSRWRAQRWLCRCDCGAERVMEVARLKSGRSRSCGKCGLVKTGRPKKPGAYGGLPGERPTEAVCPKCGRKHTVKMFWTGKGTPRRFCDKCRPYVGTYGIIYGDKTHLLRGAVL